jgi:uncharacterized membrane protein
MTRRTLHPLLLVLLLALLALPAAAQEEASPAVAPSPLPTAVPVREGPLVQAVLFFSPTCGHCHKVITETLPPIFTANGGDFIVTYDQTVPVSQVAFYLMGNDRLQLLAVDVSQPDGQAMFTADSIRLGLDQPGVPRLDVGDDHLVGSGAIPERFPGIVEEALSGAGIGWPPVPAIGAALAPFVTAGAVPDPSATPMPATFEPSAAATPAPVEASAAPDGSLALLPVGGGQDGPLARLADEPAAALLAVGVLLLLLVSVAAAPVLASREVLPAAASRLVPALAVVGFVVATYLAVVEASGSEAVCGPVGDCNAVQQSRWASVMGIPVGVMGMIGYVLLAGLWVVSRLASGSLADAALVLLALGAFGGTLYSLFLTAMEVFDIGAVCLWCISSSLIMVGLLWLSAGAGWRAWQRLRDGSGPTAHATASS